MIKPFLYIFSEGGNIVEEKDKKENDIEEEIEEQVVPPKRDFEEELLSIIRSNVPLSEIREKLDDYHDNDIASVFPKLSEVERKRLYKALSDEEISDIFSYLDDVEAYIKELTKEKAADIIESMDADDAVDVLNELDDSTRSEIIELMDEESQSDVKLIDSYSEDQIGSKMTTNYVFVRVNISVKDAMKSIVTQAADNDNISTIYVVDESDCFYGIIDLRDLVIARQGTPLEEIISTSYPYLYAKELIVDCIEKLKDYSEDSIPVLDDDNHIIGVITSSDVVEVVDEELGEDYAKLGGLSTEENIDEPIKVSVKKRIPWLIILLFLALAVSTITGFFGKVIDKLAYLVFFQSLILDMAGNVGTQSLAVTIREISNEELTGKSFWKLTFREVRIGLVNGLILGAVSCVFCSIYLLISRDMPLPTVILSSLCIGLSVLVAMILSSANGAIIPMIFKKVKIDPAVASGPLITTLNDMVGICTYYGLAMILLMNIV